MRKPPALAPAALVAFLAGVLSGSAAASPSEEVEWPQYGGGPAHDNYRPRSNAVHWPKILWRVKGASGQPTISGGSLFAGGEALHRIDPSTGRVVASHRIEGERPVRIADAPVLTSTSVIARSTDGRVFAMDQDLRAVRWSWGGPAFFDTRWAGVLADEGHYVLAAGSEVVALSPANGQVLWRFPLAEGEQVSMTPAAHEGRVFLGTERGRFLALDLATGRPAWAKEGRAAYSVTVPVVAFGAVIVGDRGIRGERPGAVVAFDEATGTTRWSTVFGATGISTPGVVADPSGAPRIAAGFGRSVAFFDTRTGERSGPAISTGANAFGSPTVVGDTVYFGNLDGHLYAHDVATGALRWAFALPPPASPEQRNQVSDFTYAHDRLYVSTSLGLFAIGQDPEQGTAPAGFVLAWTDPEAPAPARSAEPARGAPPAAPTGARTPASIASDWTSAALQIRDAALREKTIAAVRAALEGSDQVAAHAALLTLARIGPVAYDKAAMRPLVLARLKASTGSVRVAAAYALYNTAWEPGDLDLVLPIADDGSIEARRSASHLLALFAKGRLDGPAASAVERLLDSKDQDVVRETLRGLWGTSVSPGVEDRLLALAKAPATHHDAIYFGLSTLRDKSPRVVDALVDALGDPDIGNVAQRALWGLGNGVPPASQERAADGLVLLLQARDEPGIQGDAIRLLSQYGGESHAKTLDALAANPQANAAVRRAAGDGARAIRTRVSRPR